MLARLWWKEFRVFGPVWLILLAVAAGLEWFIASVNSEDVRGGGATAVNLCWALLYACAVASAAFAGERESSTLGFLDALAVGRRTLWMGKASFAIVSTIGLTLLLVGLAEIPTDRRPSHGTYSYLSILQLFGTLLFEALAWGLFWSSLSKNPLLAGAMAVVSVASSLMLSERLLNQIQDHVELHVHELEGVAIRLTLASLALGASALVMTRRPSRGWSSRDLSAVGTAGPIAPRASSTGRSLAWQAWREGWTTYLIVVLLGLMIPVGFALLGKPFDMLMDLVAIAIASLVAGVSVFGTENASGGRRFLVHHGVGPGAVWWRKMLVWVLGMASLVNLMLVSIHFLGAPLGGPQVTAIGPPEEKVGLLVTTVVNAFAVGVVCGMAIRRRITAALVGLMVLISLLPLQVGLVWSSMVPSWGGLLTPLILLAISRAWAGDWLLDREGARPWLRLGALFVVPFGLLGASYITYRALSVPDIGPQFDAAAWRATAIPPGQDAAGVYRRAARLIGAGSNVFVNLNGTTFLALDRVIADGWDPKQDTVVDFWQRNAEAIRLALEASALPRARFEADPPSMSIASTSGELLRGIGMLGQLLALDARERLSRGDLPGAWVDILAQFRMSMQLASSSPTLTQMVNAGHIHHRAVALAFDWLGDPRQAPETVRRALADLKRLPPLPDLTEALRGESSIIERSLDLSANDLAEALGRTNLGPRSTFDLLVFTKLVAPPWERLRARRVCRRLVAEELSIAKLEPWRRDPITSRRDWSMPDFQSSELARLIFPSFQGVLRSLDNEAVGRRALEQAVALMAWKLDHGGEYPGKLEDIVALGLLDRLPLDPYSGRPFGFLRSEGRMIQPLLGMALRVTRPGQPLLYSVGTDRLDNEGKFEGSNQPPGAGDLVFALP